MSNQNEKLTDNTSNSYMITTLTDKNTNEKIIKISSDDYNSLNYTKTGKFFRWGKTLNDDPEYCKFGNEILDIEITTICGGPSGKKPCAFCYKSNSLNGKNMSFETFKSILDKMPKTLNQVAFGADAMLTANQDLFRMMEYCREKEIVPNITAANISNGVADKLAKYCGAVAISRYEDKNLCYNSIKKLTDRGMNQVNIHILVSDQTFPMIMETIYDAKFDPRLKGLNAIVFLSLKQEGRGINYNKLSGTQFKQIVKYAEDFGINHGFDSCSINKYIDYLDSKKISKEERDKILQFTDSCESSLFSAYINVDGKYFPCSFCESSFEGIDVLESNNFIDVWHHERTCNFRNLLISTTDKNKTRHCPIFNV